MLLTKQLLENFNACEDGIKFCEQNQLFGFDLDRIEEVEGDYNDFIHWVKYTIINNHIKLDSHGNRIEIINGDGWLKNQYDEQNNLIIEEEDTGYWCRYEYDSNNNMLKQYTSTGFCVTLTYDDNNNIKSKVYSKGYRYRWECDDSTRTERDDLIELFYYDSMNNCIREEVNNGGLASSSWIAREYDNRNNKILHTTSYGVHIEFEYDERNNKVKEIHKDGVILYEYDDRNNLIRIQRTRNVHGINQSWVVYEYDDRNNKIFEQGSDGSTMTWVYDERDNLVTYKRYVYDKFVYDINHIVEYYDTGQLKRYSTLKIPLI